MAVGFIMYEKGGATRPLDRVVRVDVLVVRSAAGRKASAPPDPIAADAASPIATYFTVDALPRATPPDLAVARPRATYMNM